MDAPDGFRETAFDPGRWTSTTRALRRVARSIVGDDALADDVVQGAWVRALEKRGARPGVGWLRRVVRSLSIDALRRRDGDADLAAEPDERAATADELAQRVEAQRAVLDAVEALDPPYRDVVYLRHFEELGAPEIARRLGLPPKTVRTRLTRAHARLRERLSARFRRDGDARWAPALVAFAAEHPRAPAAGAPPSPPSSPVAAAPAPLVTAVVMQKLAVAAVAALVLAAGFLVVRSGADGEDAAARAPDAGAPPPDLGVERASLGEADEAPAREALESGAARTEEDPAPPPSTCALRVRVVWHDGAPAEGVAVVARTRSEDVGVARRFRRTTAADGVAAFPDLPPGVVEIVTDRGDGGAEATAEIRAGEAVERELHLADGIEVVGRVVDADGVPLAGAAIWLSSPTAGWTSGGVVARADRAGRFALRDLPPVPSIGALAAGHLPSELVDLELRDRSVQPVEVTLRARPGGGALVGTVTDVDGAPVPGALLVLGEYSGILDVRIDGTVAEGWSPPTARTDADGRYELEALVPGETDLRVRRMGWPIHRETVEVVAGRTVRRDVVLAEGATVSGVVRGADGEPVAGARLRAYDERPGDTFVQGGQLDDESPFAVVSARSDEDGRYRLDDLSPGTAYLYAQEPNASGGGRDVLRFDHAELPLAAGEARTWNPVLADGRVLAGVLRYRDGTPIGGAVVGATASADGDDERRVVHTDDGSFRFFRMEGSAYDVRAQVFGLLDGVPAPMRAGVAPGGEPIELVADCDAPGDVEPCRVVVRFEDAGRRALDRESVGVALESLDEYRWRTSECDGDAWTFEVDRMGRYRAIATTGDRLIAASDAFEATPGGRVDLGTLVSRPGGTLVLRLDRSDDAPPSGVHLVVRSDASRWFEEVPVGPGAEVRVPSVEPGTGSVRVSGDDVVPRELPFDLAAGEELVLDVPLARAARVPLRIDYAMPDGPMTMDLRIVDRGDGRAVVDCAYDDVRRFGHPVEWMARLPLGAFTLVVETGDGASARRDFDVTSFEGDEGTPVAVDVR